MSLSLSVSFVSDQTREPQNQRLGRCRGLVCKGGLGWVPACFGLGLVCMVVWLSVCRLTCLLAYAATTPMRT